MVKPTDNDMSPTDKLLRDLALKEAGWHRVEGPGGVAFFPQTATDVDAWERTAMAQAQESERMEVATRPPSKVQPTDLKRGRVVRSD